jgi:general secretion pathway protein J
MAALRSSRGFTLVELLVALFAMALLAIMSWRGLDGMVRAKEQTQARSDEVLTLQVGLSQWAADLDALIQLPQTKALEWNGRVLRMTRRGTTSPADGLVVVAWTRRVTGSTGTWLRWQSPPVMTRGDLENAWQRAGQWSQNPSDEDRAREVAVAPLEDWQLFYFRENAWTNPQSSDVTTSSITLATPPAIPASGTTPAPAPAPAIPGVIAGTQQLPDGVRLVIVLPPGQAISGTITRDWVRPNATAKRS